MNLLLVAAQEVASDGEVCLRDRRASHLIRVLRVEPGRQLRVGVIRGGLGSAEVVAVSSAEVRLRVRVEGCAARPRVDVLLAMPRPKVLSRVLEGLAAFGVDRVALVNAWRVEKAYFGSPRLEPSALEQSLLLGCEQGLQTWLPEVKVEALFVPFVRERLPRWFEEQDTIGLVADPHAPRWPEQVIPPGHAARVVIAVGPEGGWIPAELESLAQAGLRAVSLGSAVLRVEPAIHTLLAQVALLRRWRPGSPLDGDRDKSTP